METGLPVSSLLLTLPGLIIWTIILFLPWRPWSTRESLDSNQVDKGSVDLSRITVLIPARNEEDVITGTLDGLYDQGTGLKIYVIDDQSKDQTAARIHNKQSTETRVIKGKPLPEEWSGKLWALEQGKDKVETELVLLLDADIKLLPGLLPTVLKKFDNEQLDMLSLMAALRMVSFWEKLLMPAFIFFFKLLYPFQLSNSSLPFVAAAAGGFILIKRELLEKTGAFGSLRQCLIDDCTLARKVKSSGGKIWTGLSHSVISQRTYNTLDSIWNMVARTAYTQLAYSKLLLVFCTLLMIICFVLPVISVFPQNLWYKIPASGTLLIMYFCYLPTLKYYNIHPGWGFVLPVTGIFYLCMTWSSAWQHWFKSGSSWKDRNYSTGVHR